MKYGVADYGMNVYDGDFYSLEERLAMLKSIGYDGIERLNASDSAFAIQNAATFRKMGMSFATACGLKMEQTLTWSAAFGCEYVWVTVGPATRNVNIDVFCRRANKLIEVCKKYNLKAATAESGQNNVKERKSSGPSSSQSNAKSLNPPSIHISKDSG